MSNDDLRNNEMRDEIINDIINVEGGYVDDPSDSGGETNFGITKEVARNHGYKGEMIDLPRATAFDIYVAMYWAKVYGDALAGLSKTIAHKVVDIAVNMGPGRAAGFLQRTLNVLNSNESLYSDIDVDSSIGSATISALECYLEDRDADMLVRALNCLQGAFYIELAEKRSKDEKFLYGWLKNRITMPV